MVKIPSLDELRKMGTDLMNSAKNVDMTGVVDKIKNKVETVSEKFSGPGTIDAKTSLARVNTGLVELMALQPAEINAIKKIQADVLELQKRIEASEQAKAAAETKATSESVAQTPTSQHEEKKDESDRT